MLFQEEVALDQSILSHGLRCEGAQVNGLPHLLFQINTDGTILEFIGQGDSSLIVTPDKILGKQIFDVMPSLAEPLMQFVESSIMNAQLKMFEDKFMLEDAPRSYEVKAMISGMNTVLAIVREVADNRSGIPKCESHGYQDTLTNLPNRYLFRDRLSQALAIAERKGLMVKQAWGLLHQHGLTEKILVCSGMLL